MTISLKLSFSPQAPFRRGRRRHRRRHCRGRQQQDQTSNLSGNNINPDITDNSPVSATQRQEEVESGSTSIPSSSSRVPIIFASNSVENMCSQVKTVSRPISIISASSAPERMDSAVALVDDQGDVFEMQNDKGKAIAVALEGEDEEKEELSTFVGASLLIEKSQPIDIVCVSSKGKGKVSDDCVLKEDQLTKKEENCHFDKLPLEIKVKVFKCLDVFEVVRASMVCRAWYSLAFDGSLWSRLDVAPFYQRIKTDQLTALWKAAGGFLKEVNFRGCVQLNPLDLREMTPYCPNIQKLQLSGCRNLDFGSVDFLLQHLHNLEDLDLSGLLFIINPTCYTLAKECKRLKKVKLSWCQYIDFRGIKQLVKGCKELVSLKLDGLPKLNEQALAMVGELQHLRVLSLDSCPTVDDASITALFQSSNDISSTVACTMTTYSLSPPQISHLNLSNNRNLTDTALQDLADFCPNLSHLQVHNCPGFTDHGLIYLASKCTQLQAIDLEDCSTAVNDDVLNAFATHLRKLQMICLSYCELITDDGVTNLFRECTNLARIDLDQCQSLTDTVLRNITSILTTAASMGLIAGAVTAATTADSASHNSLYDDGASSISGNSERRQLATLARNGVRPQFIEIEIFDCRNISVLAVRQAIRQVNATGVSLKVKGYYTWQTASNANNNAGNNNGVGTDEEGEGDDNGGVDNGTNRPFWSRMRPFRHLRGTDLWSDFAMRFQFTAAFRGAGRGTPARRLRQCTIL